MKSNIEFIEDCVVSRRTLQENDPSTRSQEIGNTQEQHADNVEAWDESCNICFDMGNIVIIFSPQAPVVDLGGCEGCQSICQIPKVILERKLDIFQNFVYFPLLALRV